MQLNFYVAPMEGLTGHTFRQVFHSLFASDNSLTVPSKYYMPFMAPHRDGSVKTREKKEYDPAHNQGIIAVPQILTNHAESFVIVAKQMKALGYPEVNVNLGCPYPTVVKKGKGAGMLEDLTLLEMFLDRLFQEQDLPAVSIKTRLSQDEDPKANEYLFRLYQRYPISELIVHPRRQKDAYRGKVDRNTFAQIAWMTTIPLCYNGGLFTAKDIHAFSQSFPAVHSVMLGRGLIRNPALIRETLGGEALSLKELRLFHDQLYSAYREVSSGPGPVLGRMKELWLYWETILTDRPRAMKKMYKARTCEAYEAAAAEVFDQASLLAKDERPRNTEKLVLC